jgi:hypothetical protein
LRRRNVARAGKITQSQSQHTSSRALFSFHNPQAQLQTHKNKRITRNALHAGG